MKIDLHVHASERSACAVVSEEEQAAAAVAVGLDAMVFTDHHRLVPAYRLAAMNQKFSSLRIFGGVEITADKEDWLVLGIQDPLLEREDWHYPELHRYVRSRDGFIALAHPFRYAPQIAADLDAFTPDGIEVRSRNTPTDRETQIRAIAAKHHLALLEDSDAHAEGHIGKYFNQVDQIPVNDQELVALLKSLRK